MTFFNVGSNKGYAVADFLGRFRSRAAPSKQAWHASILSYGSGKAAVATTCGVCNACRELPPPAHAHLWAASGLAVVAFDISEPSVVLLQSLVSTHNLSRIAAVQVYHLAVTNSTGVVFTRQRRGRGTAAGNEGVSAKVIPGGGFTSPLLSVSIDEFVTSQAMHRINWLSVDAEGLDALVLEGASRLLREKRVDLVEFLFTA